MNQSVIYQKMHLIRYNPHKVLKLLHLSASTWPSQGMLKHVKVLVPVYELYVIKCICWQIIDYKYMHGMNNIKFTVTKFTEFREKWEDANYTQVHNNSKYFCSSLFSHNTYESYCDCSWPNNTHVSIYVGNILSLPLIILITLMFLPDKATCSAYLFYFAQTCFGLKLLQL
jgi:hypothetical protein